jgi:hypothetical protein
MLNYGYSEILLNKNKNVKSAIFILYLFIFKKIFIMKLRRRM